MTAPKLLAGCSRTACLLDDGKKRKSVNLCASRRLFKVADLSAVLSGKS